MCPTQRALLLEEVAPEHRGPLHLHRLGQLQAWAGAHTQAAQQLWQFRSHMTTVTESQRRAGGGRGGMAVTPSSSGQCSSSPLTIVAAAAPAEAPGGGEAPLAAQCSSMLTHLPAPSQLLGGLLTPVGPGGHPCCSGQPSGPSPLATTSQFSRKPLTARPARKQQTSLFLLEPDSRNRVFPPSSPSARPARCSAISRCTWSRSGPGSQL